MLDTADPELTEPRVWAARSVNRVPARSVVVLRSEQPAEQASPGLASPLTAKTGVGIAGQVATDPAARPAPTEPATSKAEPQEQAQEQANGAKGDDTDGSGADASTGTKKAGKKKA